MADFSAVGFLEQPDLLHAPFGMLGFLGKNNDQKSGAQQGILQSLIQIAAGRKLGLIAEDPFYARAFYGADSFGRAIALQKILDAGCDRLV